MEVFLAAEVKETRTYASMVCNLHLSLLQICRILRCPRTTFFFSHFRIE